ncbi:hypothetical protein [Acinetobacter junii]|uniref:Uncharacterized protein n=1 Tax=Acinetobacter junii TaxID=40215 RepID=A0AAW5R579_ACIJU|nr:hypothetical protein [Acinetobacter junii]MCU4395848.1 hypothetical protein [Acinetobacter junii]
MEQKLSQNNITFSFSNVMFISAVIALIVIVGITIAFSQPVSSKADETFIPNTRPSSLGVIYISITSKDTGIGTVNLDGYLVPVEFKFEAKLRDYGVTESQYPDVTITRLDIGKIKNSATGEYVDDFTIFQDHKQINEAIKNFIESNKLVEVR